MASHLPNKLAVDTTTALAEQVIDRFQQLLIIILLSDTEASVSLAQRATCDITLPDQMNEPTTVTLTVRAVMTSAQQQAVACSLDGALGHEVEQRIRYLTHTHQARYGKLLHTLYCR